MNAIITPSKAVGELPSVVSKSVAHRLLICSAFSNAKTLIRCENTNKDIMATVNCLKAMGAEISYEDGYFSVCPINQAKKCDRLLCNESGSTMRFTLPIVCALGGTWHFIMEGRLPHRPLSPLKEELEAHGIQFVYITENDLCVHGKLSCGEYSISGNVSSQFVSGLLFALSILKGQSKLNVTEKIESAPYIEMTIDALLKFGADIKRDGNIFTITGKELNSPGIAEVENDWSNAAFPLSAAALCKGTVTLDNVNFSSHQGDMKILGILEQFGAVVKKESDKVTVIGNKLQGIEINAEQIPDLVPVLAAVASGAKGTTKIYGASRLRIKESDRLQTTYEMLSTLGADIKLTDDGFIVNGKDELTGGTVNSYNDHRIAMSAAVAATICKNDVILLDAGATSKSYPKFWEDMKKINLNIELKY